VVKSSQQINTAQALQSGNLSGAQSAFATLQRDLEQIGGFSSSSSGSSTGTSASSSTSRSLSISA
jgi:Tfp pilus assembly protein PilW